MHYSITTVQLTALAKARSAQTKAARAVFTKQKQRPWLSQKTNGRSDGAKALVTSAFANVEFVNGSTTATVLPVQRLAEWARIGGKQTFVMEIPPCCGCVILRRTASSFIRLPITSTAPVGNQKRLLEARSFGTALRLVAPSNGGEFTLQRNLSNLP